MPDTSAQRQIRLNTFPALVLIDRSETGAGNFDIEFNHDQVQWKAETRAPEATTDRAGVGTGRFSNGSGATGRSSS